MKPRSTEELIARLADDATPVRPVPALRSQLLGVGGAWLVTAAGVALWAGLRPAAVLERGGVSAGVTAALGIAGGLGLVAGLAARMPGRERLATGAAIAAASAFAALFLGALASSDAFARSGSLAQCMECSRHALLLALPVGVVALVLALRGAGWGASLAGLALAVGASSLGALLVHLSCPSLDPWHWLVAHAALPIGGGVALGLLARALLRGAARRDERKARERAAR